MPRLIDADALIEEMKPPEDAPNDGAKLVMSVFIAAVESQPTIDAVPVVRCRECKHYKPSRYNTSTAHYCGVIDGFPKEHWFCADGQRREEADT